MHVLRHFFLIMLLTTLYYDMALRDQSCSF